MGNLRGAHQGYRYQDIIAEKVVCWALSLYTNPSFIVDEKDNRKDYIEDIKVIAVTKKDCFQIKHSKNRELKIDDFKNDGELSIERLYEYDKSQSGYSIRYFFLLKWKSPSDELKNLLVDDDLKIFAYTKTKFFKFGSSNLHDICLKFNLEENSNTGEFLQRVHIICDMPDSSRDFNNPKELEDDLIRTISNLGIGKFPNESILPEQFAINLFNELNFYRSNDVFKVSANELLKKLCVCVDFGKLKEVPNINESFLVSDEDGINAIFDSVNKNERTLLAGEPGSGKTYFCYSFEGFLRSRDISYTKHYFYIDTSDIDLAKRSRGDYLIGNLLSIIYERYPVLKKHGSLFGASIDDLNLALNAIEERLVILIDGVDHAFRNYLCDKEEDLIGLINKIATNENVHLLLISQPLSRLETLKDFSKFTIKKWDEGNIKVLAQKKNIALNDDVISTIVEKGQGNPLYISYLLENVDDLQNSPVYDGDIKNYYSYLIKRSDSPHLFQYFVSIPFSFTEEEFSIISNSGNDGKNFVNRHLFLLKSDNFSSGYRVYHESLIRFLFDYCDKEKIDLNQTKRSVISYLKQQPFYSNFKAYNYINQLCYEVGDLDSIFNYVSYEFLASSLYYGRCLTEIKNNFEFFRKAVCRRRSFELYAKYLLMKKCIDVYFDEEFAADQSPDYFIAHLSVMGEAGLESLLMRDYSPKTADLIYYSAAMDGIIAPASILKNQVDYSKFERDYSLSDVVIKHYHEGKSIKEIKEGIPFSHKLEIVRTMNEMGKIQDLSSTSDEDLKSLLNQFSYEPICNDASNRVKLDFEKNYYKEDFAKILCDFVSAVNCGLIDSDQVTLISDLQECEFIFAVFRLVIDNHTAYATFKGDTNQQLFDQTLLDNIVSFKNRVEPFKGKPRACDFTSVEFRYIFINVLLMPLRYLTVLQGEYFNEVLRIKDKLETSVRGAVMSCISLDEILENVKRYLDGSNTEVVLKAIEDDVISSLPNYEYVYSAGFCYKLSRLYKGFDDNKQLEFYKKGITYSLCYGWHKDIFFEEIIDAFRAVRDYIDKPIENLIEIGDMSYALDYHTDGKETKWFFLDWIRLASEKNVANCANYICDRRLNHCYNWKIDIGTGIVLEHIYDKISSKLLLYLLVSNQFERSYFDYDIYYYCLKKLVNEKELDLVYQLLNYLVSLKKEFACEASFVGKLNSIISTKNLDFQPFKAEFNQETHKRQELLSLSSIASLDEISSIDNYRLTDLAEAIFNNKPLSDGDKDKLEKLFNNYRNHPELNDLCDLILAKEWSDDDKAYLYAASFFYCRDGWDKAYVRTDFFENGIKQNQDLFKQHLFSIIERNQDVWRGIAGICNGLSLNCETRVSSINIWKFIKDFTEKRLPDCSHEIDIFQFSEDDSLEDIGLNLLLSGLNDYGLDNHKTILRFVDSEIQLKNESVIKWIVNNWNNLKIFTKLDILTLLLRNNFDFKSYSELTNCCVENDDDILSRVLLSSIRDNRNVKAIPPFGLFFGNEEQRWCYMNLFRFRVIHDFCGCQGIDSDLFLKIYKEKIRSKTCGKEFKIFYSMSSLRPIDNFYRYNTFLEAANEFLNELAEEDVSESDLFDLAFALLPLEESICTNCFGPFLNNSDFVTLASYEVEEIQKGITKEEHLKVEKDISVAQLETNGHCLLLNNIDSICKMKLYDYQIEFAFPFEAMSKYKIERKEIGGSCSYFIGDEMVAIFQILKTEFNGIEQYHDRYYLNEKGRFYIKKEFLDRICIDYGYSNLVHKSETRKINYCV